MHITPLLRTRQHWASLNIVDDWADWGFKEDDHHLILINFFESWQNSRKEPNFSATTLYESVARVLNEHYLKAQFPADADRNPYVYWLAGHNRTPLHSFCNSREYFNKRYLAEFGPLFDVAEWLNAYRKDPEAAVDELAARAAEAQETDRRDRENQRPVGTNQHSEPVYNGENVIHTLRPTGTSAAAAHRRLRKDRPEIHARVLAGEITAHAGMIEAGFRKPRPRDPLPGLTKLRRAWAKASPEERAIFKREIG